MRLNRLLIPALVAASLGATKADAVSVAIYHTDPGAAAAAANATIGQAATLSADASVVVDSIDFSAGDSTATTIAQFLGNPAGLAPAVGGLTLNNTYFLFTGTSFLAAGNNMFSVPHDDGVQLLFPAISSDLLIDAPGVTSEVSSPFTVVAPFAGAFAFTLSYGETGGGEAVIRFAFNDSPVVDGVPEPASWALLVAGFGLVGGTLRRARHRTVTA